MASHKVRFKHLVDRVKGVSGYFVNDERLISFVKFYPENVDPDVINSKVSSLRTGNIGEEFKKMNLSFSIMQIQLDPMFVAGDFLAVTKIADISGESKRLRFLEFASRYCAAHKPNVFPIWNGRSERIISHFWGRNITPGHYVQYARYFTDFKKIFGMQELNFFEIDKLFWIHQKELERISFASS